MSDEPPGGSAARPAVSASRWHRGRRTWALIRRTWITLGLTFTAGFVGWSLIAYRASPMARRATEPDAQVAVTHAQGVWRFEPRMVERRAATLVFFPGALVDPRAYAPLARAVAAAGFPVFLVELPRRAAFGGADSPALAARIRTVLAAAGPIVVAGGHSRGAVVATRLAAEQPAALRGLVLIGTSHPRDHDLSRLAIPVTKLAGTRDGLASPAEVRQNAHLLPPQTRWVWIEGGNHSQFGWYGFQPMDRRPRVSARAQRQVMVASVLELMEEAAAP